MDFDSGLKKLNVRGFNFIFQISEPPRPHTRILSKKQVSPFKIGGKTRVTTTNAKKGKKWRQKNFQEAINGHGDHGGGLHGCKKSMSADQDPIRMQPCPHKSKKRKKIENDPPPSMGRIQPTL